MERCCRYYAVALRSLGLALGAFALFAVPQLTPERYVHHPLDVRADSVQRVPE